MTACSLVTKGFRETSVEQPVRVMALASAKESVKGFIFCLHKEQRCGKARIALRPAEFFQAASQGDFEGRIAGGNRPDCQPGSQQQHRQEGHAREELRL